MDYFRDCAAGLLCCLLIVNISAFDFYALTLLYHSGGAL